MPGSPTIVDHLFAALLVIGVPSYAARISWPRMKRRGLADAAPAIRIRISWGVMGAEWLLAALAVAAWIYGGRSWADLGFALRPGWRLWAPLWAAAAIAIGLTVQYVVVMRRAEGRARVRAEVRRAAPFAPQTRREMRHFALLAVTAGVCEEILYRGFLIWYVSQFTGVGVAGLTLAVAASALAFAVAHLYQGPAGAARVAGLALVFGALYVLGRSLWPVMLLHVYIDLAGGYLALRAHEEK